MASEDWDLWKLDWLENFQHRTPKNPEMEMLQTGTWAWGSKIYHLTGGVDDEAHILQRSSASLAQMSASGVCISNSKGYQRTVWRWHPLPPVDRRLEYLNHTGSLQWAEKVRSSRSRSLNPRCPDQDLKLLKIILGPFPSSYLRLTENECRAWKRSLERGRADEGRLFPLTCFYCMIKIKNPRSEWE